MVISVCDGNFFSFTAINILTKTDTTQKGDTSNLQAGFFNDGALPTPEAANTENGIDGRRRQNV